MRPRTRGFIYPDALEGYMDSLKELDYLTLADEGNRELLSLESKLKVMEEACRADDGLEGMQDAVYTIIGEALENHDRAKAIHRELCTRLNGGNGKGA